MAIGRFYGMIGALLWHAADDTYLVLRRSAEKDFAGGFWECITGRVDQGEGFVEALHREVYEELGVEVQIDFVVGMVHLYRGEAIPQNEMIGVQFCCSLETPAAIEPSWEHSEYRWITADEAEELFPEGYWLKDTIRRAARIRALMPEELLDYYRSEGG